MHLINTRTIETSRLILVCCTKEIMDALLQGDAAVANILGVQVPTNWTMNGEREFRWVLDNMSRPGADPKWLMYLSVLKEENTLVGGGGFKGAPQNGVVEIGYEVAPAYRCKGFATEMAKALMQFAFQQPEITKVQAHTLAIENESGSVLKKCGMQKAEALYDPEDGNIWRWELAK
jgi:ribosomal-protein-alanine N-acetyltransferase